MRLKPNALFSLGEENTYRVLRNYLRDRPYVIYKEVALSQVIHVKRSELPPREWRYYTSASFDFVICRDQDRQPLELVIEFDGAFHDDPDQEWRDTIKNSLCDKVGLPIVRIRSDHLLSRESVPFLKYMLDLYFGEKGVQELISSGRVSPDEEYFPGTTFDGTIRIKKRLEASGVFPAIVPLLLSAESAEKCFWYRIISGLGKIPFTARTSACTRSTRVELMQGWAAPKSLLSVERTAILRECAPAHNVPGIHSWFIAQEFALFLALQEFEKRAAKLFRGKSDGKRLA